ncbi:MAG: PAS domain S-box protein, partial [Quisquiliibacterium sp.]
MRSAQGDVFGAVVVNHDAQNLLTELQAIAIDSGQLYVTDQRGQFLVHPSAGVAFAHESDPGKPGLVWNQQFAPESKPEGLLGAALPDGLEAMRGPNGPVIFASLNNASVFGDASDEQRLQVRIGMAPQVLSERIAHERSDIFYPQVVAFGTAFLCGALVLLAVSRRSALQSARNQERFQTIFTDAPGAQLILDMSRQRVTDCNQAALALFGMSRDELVSLRVPQLFADSESGGLPSRLSAVSTLESALSGVGVEFSAWLARARGARFLAEVRGRRIEIEDEPALLIHLTDVTEADRLQVMLRAARDRLQWLADRVPVMIAQFDLERRYRFANASYAQWYGRDADQLVGLHVREVIGEEGYSESSGHIAETLSGAPLVEYERTVRKATGDRTLLIRNVPDLDEQGELSGYIVALTDVTTLRLAEQQLLESREVIQAQANRLRVLNVQLTERAELADQASRAKSEFLSTMSHELRTPLNAVIGYATLLKASVVDAQPRESIDRILAASEHLLAMISDVLDFDRIEGGYLELVAEDFSLLDLLAQVQAIVELQAEEKGLVLRVDVASGDLWLLGDKGRLRQCLLNYLSNALKFTDSGSITVTVETVSADEREIMLRFAVSDTGIGIATQEQL